MFLDYKYLGIVQGNGFKVEIYDTGKRELLFKKVYAYQMFYENKLIHEDEHFIPLSNNLIDAFQEEINSMIEQQEALQIEYIPVEALPC